MSEMTFRSDMGVTLVDHMGSDARICQAARVSTKGSESYGAGESEGLINFLMKNRHGSPFEHVLFTWLIEAPIFVWREFMRHRMASYNEESGRYKKLAPVFYVPGADRKLVQIGKTGAYEFVDGDSEQINAVPREIEYANAQAFDAYEYLLSIGIAKEVARMALPVNIYSSAYVTMNFRGLMNFLSLRTKVEGSAHVSFPQREIEMVAEQMEESIKHIVPVALGAFNLHGRQQP